MLNTIWCGMLFLSIAAALLNGQVPALANALGNGAQEAVTMALSMTGMMCAWSGLLKIAGRSGLSEKITVCFRPLIHLLFPAFKEQPQIQNKIAMNFSANLLGLGNAATPIGLAAVKEMAALQTKQPSPALMLFIVINTSSLQLVPTYAITLRSHYGSASPYDILPGVWLVSLASLAVCVTAAKCFEAGARHD